MSWLDRLIPWRKQQKRSETDSGWWQPLLDAGYGKTLTAETAVSTNAVYACVAALSEIIGSLPLITYERNADGSRERAQKSHIYWLLTSQPNSWMCSGELVQWIVANLMLTGNAFLYKIRDNSFRITQLVPVKSHQMRVEQDENYNIRYIWTPKNSAARVLPTEAIIHFKWGLSNGLVGRSPISIVRETMSLSHQLESHASSMLKNIARPGGVLAHPGNISPEARANMKQSWKESHSGSRVGEVAILEEGVKFEPITMSAEDSQFVEQRRFQIEECARTFRIPPHIIGELSRATFSNIEHQGISFVQYSCYPLLKRIEQSLQMGLFAGLINGKELFCEFLVDGLLRGDTKSRQESYEIQRRNGILSANEWRRLENMSPIKDERADEYLLPVNMAYTGAMPLEVPNEPAKLPEPEIPSAQKSDGNGETQRHLSVYAERMFESILARLIAKESRAVEKLKKQGKYADSADEFFASHRKIYEENIAGSVGLYYAQCCTRANRYLSSSVPASVVEECWIAYLQSRDVEANYRVQALAKIIRSIIEQSAKGPDGNQKTTEINQ